MSDFVICSIIVTLAFVVLRNIQHNKTGDSITTKPYQNDALIDDDFEDDFDDDIEDKYSFEIADLYPTIEETVLQEEWERNRSDKPSICRY